MHAMQLCAPAPWRIRCSQRRKDRCRRAGSTSAGPIPWTPSFLPHLARGIGRFSGLTGCQVLPGGSLTLPETRPVRQEPAQRRQRAISSLAQRSGLACPALGIETHCYLLPGLQGEATTCGLLLPWPWPSHLLEARRRPPLVLADQPLLSTPSSAAQVPDAPSARLQPVQAGSSACLDTWPCPE